MELTEKKRKTKGALIVLREKGSVSLFCKNLREVGASFKSRGGVNVILIDLRGGDYKKCCILPRAEALAKMQKALANGRLPGVLPGAQSPAILVITNDHARALAPGKFAGFCILCQHHISHFQTMPETLPGVNPWQNADEFYKKKKRFIFA